MSQILWVFTGLWNTPGEPYARTLLCPCHGSWPSHVPPLALAPSMHLGWPMGHGPAQWTLCCCLCPSCCHHHHWTPLPALAHTCPCIVHGCATHAHGLLTAPSDTMPPVPSLPSMPCA